MITNIILLIIGFIILIKGADLFIDGISSMAINLKVAKIIISLTIVAFGTSAPELAISIQGMMNESGSLVLANVIGSTIVNTMLIIGTAALIKPIKVKNETVKQQLPLHLITIIIFTVLMNLFMIKGGDVLVEIGPLSIEEKGLYTAFFMASRLILLIIGSSMLTLTTKPPSFL